MAELGAAEVFEIILAHVAAINRLIGFLRQTQIHLHQIIRYRIAAGSTAGVCERQLRD